MRSRSSRPWGVRIALIFVVALAAFPVTQAYWTWTSETLAVFDTFDFHGLSLSLQPGTPRYPAIAWVSRVGNNSSSPTPTYSVMFTKFDGTSWVSQRVDGKTDGNIGCDLVFNPITGQPAIAYGGANLRFAQWDGTAWRVQVVDPTKAWNTKVSLAFVPGTSRPAISYHASVGKGTKETSWLRYAEFTGSGWRIESVDSPGVRQRTWLVFDPVTSAATIAYSANLVSRPWPLTPLATLKFATRTSASNWEKTTVSNAPGSGYDLSLAYDNAGIPAIVDRAGEDYNHQSLRYFRRDGEWQGTDIIAADEQTVAASSILKFDQDGLPMVLYQRGGNYNELVIARLINGAWTHDVVFHSEDRQGTYDQTSLALDDLLRPAIAYRFHLWGTNTDSMMYARSW